MLKMINDNSYKTDFPCEYNVSSTFNVFYLSPFTAEDKDFGLTTNLSQQDEDLGLTTNLSQEVARE